MAGELVLNRRQRLFAHEYLRDFNATHAAVRAGYSPRTAHSQGPRLLEHVGVRKAIRDAIDRIARDPGRVGVSIDYWKSLIEKWWHQYEPGDDDLVVSSPAEQQTIGDPRRLIRDAAGGVA